jgi:predicted transcriptional regulator
MTAKEILQLLKKEPRQTPKSIVEKTGLNLQMVYNTLSVLQEVGLVEAPTRGLYEITKLGEKAIQK